MTKADKQSRKRFTLSVSLALLVHALFFLVFHYFIPLKTEIFPKYGGPIIVTIGEPERAVPKASEFGTPKRVAVEKREAAKTEAKIQEARPRPEPARAQKPAEVDSARPTVVTSEERKRLPSQDRETKVASSDRAGGSAEGGMQRVERPEYATKFEPIPPEQTSDVHPVPEIPAALLTPDVAQKSVKTRPFDSDTVVTESPLAFDLSELDQAIDKSKKERSTSGESPGEVQSGVQAGKKGTGLAQTQDGTVTGRPNAPLITWEKPAQERKLLFQGPQPDIPQWVKREGIDLKVVVLFGVTPEGQTILVSTVISSGYPDVDTAVLDSVRKMKFNPVSGSEVTRGTVSYIIRTR